MKFHPATWLMGIFAILVAGASLAWAGNVTSDARDARDRLAILETKMDEIKAILVEVKQELRSDRNYQSKER
jgi:hypothetical protein